MRKIRVALAAVLAAGIVSALAGPATANPLPCKVFIGSTYVANTPLCTLP